MGFETARQLGKKGYRLILGARSEAAASEAAEKLDLELDLDIYTAKLDITCEDDVNDLAEMLNREHGQIDVLVNNAGVLPDHQGAARGVLDSNEETLRQALEVNLLGTFRVTRMLAPLLAEGGRIVNVSSRMGQLNDIASGYPAYRISKTALNALTGTLSAELANRNILVNAVCPGWVRTERCW